jgi:hypothetical protein
LWRDLHAMAAFDPAQAVLVEEACRMVDRLDRLDAILRGERATLVEIVFGHDGEPLRLAVDGVLAEARQQANVLKQLLTALRLPDQATGVKPQYRGARGAYNTASGKSAKDRLKAV